MSELLSSFSSANVFPAKILHHEKLIHSCLHEHKVFPIHVQLNPTNSCQLNCGFCSCSGRDKTLQLSLSEVEEIMTKARELGCESVTCTGGGEPLLHKEINDIFWMLDMLNIEIGLVTNGLLLNCIENEASKGIVWIRISSSEELPQQLESIRKTTDEWFEIIKSTCEAHPHIDYAFSHVLTTKQFLTVPFTKRLIRFANKQNFSHVRIVSDIFNPLPVKMKMLREHLHLEVDDSKVIYQDRAAWVHGQNPCYISLLKPVIDAKGYVLPCCGVQYALEHPSRDYEESMRMGKAIELENLVKKQIFFNGSQCVRCYYDHYNWALSTLLGNVKHEKFI